MTPAVAPIDEEVRLEALREYAVLDTPPERALDDLTLLAATICETPIALISLVDEQRQWFKSKVGLEVVETPREISFSAHALLQAGLFIVPDALLDARFAENPQVTGEPHVRFYAGTPLVSPEGAPLGTLCVMDRVPRTLTAAQEEALRVLGRQVMTHLKLRRQWCELQVSEGKLRAIFESGPEGVKLLGPDATVLAMNAAALRLIEADSLESVADRSLLPVIVPEDRETVRGMLEAVSRGETRTVRFRIVGLKGTSRWVEMSGAPFRDEATGRNCVLGVSRDITEGKQAEEALRASEARYRALFENAPDGILIGDAESRYLDANASMCRMLGYTRAELVGMDASQIIAGDERARIGATIGSIHAGRDHHQEWQLLRKDGSAFPADVIATRMPDGNLLGMIRDLTERKKLEEQFLRSQRMESIGTLAGGIAHDLNNALSPIMMSLSVLRMRFPDDASLELLDIISASAERGADMVRQVLSFACGIEGRRMEVQFGHLIRDVEKIAGDTFLKNIQIRTVVPHELWTVMGDPTQLHQVVMNLCLNARDAMPDGGVLTMCAENIELDAHYAGLNAEARLGPYVCFDVEDSGVGIPPENIGRIFDPFFTTKEVGKGTGLGLSTSVAIIKSHGGFIRVYSEPGKGTKFKVCLPANPEAPGAAITAAGSEMPRGNGEMVLVVDDEASVRLITQQTLEAFGYRAVLAADGADAVSVYAVRRAEIAVVLTDMTMPVMDGSSTIMVLRRMNPALPIIATSGLSASEEEARAARLGVKHFLPKPYTAAILLQALKVALSDEA